MTSELTAKSTGNVVIGVEMSEKGNEMMILMGECRLIS